MAPSRPHNPTNTSSITSPTNIARPAHISLPLHTLASANRCLADLLSYAANIKTPSARTKYVENLHSVENISLKLGPISGKSAISTLCLIKRATLL